MKKLSITVFTFIIFSTGLSVQAQRVVRKGVKPLKETVVIQSAPAKFSTGQLNGKWQEMSRTVNGERKSFTDTLMLHFENGKAAIRDANSMTMTMSGNVSVEAPATVSIGGYEYNIRSLNKNVLLLEDEGTLREMHRVGKYYFETVGKDSIKLPEYTDVVTADLRKIEGKWNVYRRTAAPSFITNSTVLIKSITIVPTDKENVAFGEIVTYDGANIMETTTCGIGIAPGSMNITSKKGTFLMQVYKASADELIFGDNRGVVNYAKR